MKSFSLIFGLVLFTSTAVFAQEDGCVSKETARDIMSRYAFKTQVGKKWKTPTLDNLCDDSFLIVKVLKALELLESLPALNQTSNIFQPATISGQPKEFFAKRIHEIRLQNSNHGLCKENAGFVAFVDSSKENTLYICPIFRQATTFDGAYVLMHEARHTEGFDHVACTQGRFNGISMACDSSFEEQGSYGIGTNFASGAARTQGLPGDLRQEARAKALVDYVSRFNKLPFDLKPGKLLTKKDGMLAFFDGVKMTEFPIATPAQSITAMRVGVPVYFNPAEASVKAYSYAEALTEAPGQFAKLFRESFTQTERNDLLDVSYGPKDYACLLFARNLRCGPHGIKEKDLIINLDIVNPLHLMFAKNLPSDESPSLYIVDQSQNRYLIPKSWEEMKNFSEDDLVETQSKSSMMSLATGTDGQELGISWDGKFQELQKIQWKNVPNTQSEEFKKILDSDFYWSRDLEKL